MNREIKFRAWVKKEKEMTKVLGFETRNDAILHVLYNDNSKYTLGMFAVELMQYTGLKDKNGKEVYEGDILLSSNENGTFLQLIGFGDSEREYDSILKGFKIINGYTLENDDYEIIECKPLTQELVKKYDIPVIEKENIIMDGWWVIGNKWENPELMKLLEGKDDKKG